MTGSSERTSLNPMPLFLPIPHLPCVLDKLLDVALKPFPAVNSVQERMIG